MTARHPVVFVSHEGSRTGAPMALLHLVRWLADHSDIEPRIAIIRDGPLTAEFAEVGPTTVLSDEVDWPSPDATERWLADHRLGALARRRVVARMADRVAPVADARAVYLNSAASLRLLRHLRSAERTVLHVHELRAALGWSVSADDAPLLRTRVDHVIAAADCVADNLVEQFAVPRPSITRIYEFIDPAEVLAPPGRSRDELRAELGVPADALVVGGSGWADWRKGIDLFVQLARALVAPEPAGAGRDDVHLVWVGGLPGGTQGEQIAFDVERSGVSANVHLVGLQANPHDWYRTFDVFALTSREDPYPLVGLETSLLEVPMLCFDRAGGMVELVRRSVDDGLGESGVVVPYLDVEAMATAALDLLDDPARRAGMGRTAASVVHRDHRIASAGPQVLEVIERVLMRTAP